MSTENEASKTPVSTIAFDRAARFCENGNTGLSGRAVRFTTDTVIAVSGGEDLPVQAGGVAFRLDADGLLTSFNAADFKAHFSRVLCNGEQVKLSADGVVQAAKIREAEDSVHRNDFLKIQGQAVWRGLVGFARDAQAKAVNSETVDELRQAAGDLQSEVGETVEGVCETVRNKVTDATVRFNMIRTSPAADKVRKGLRRLVWGKLGNG